MLTWCNKGIVIEYMYDMSNVIMGLHMVGWNNELATPASQM